MSEATVIDSLDAVDAIETPFRVQAGPGAGKTYWLVHHIRKVLKESERLGQGQKIACISYTNVAVEELEDDLFELGVRGDKVEVSTIHSFLYRNVVKPYVHLLTDDDGEALVDYAEMDGHKEHRSSVNKVYQWIEKSGANWSLFHDNRADGVRFLEGGRWSYGDEGWEFVSDVKSYLNNTFPAEKIWDYKSLFWQRGTVHHEDVLLFAHKVLTTFGGISSLLTARFPYLFIDEFQDTGFTQAELTKWLSEHGTVVGVIGDVEQSIYGFRGAKPDELEGFEVEGLTDYAIEKNHRSTRTIVEFLNDIRCDDLQQRPPDGAERGQPVRCLVGSRRQVSDRFSEATEGHESAILSYRNDTVAAFRADVDSESDVSDGVWDLYREKDSNFGRVYFMQQALRATRLATSDRLGAAVREMRRGIRIRDGELRDPFKSEKGVTALERRGMAIALVQRFTNKMEEWSSQSLFEVYNGLVEWASEEFGDEFSMKCKYRSGNSREFAEGHTVGELFRSVKSSLGGETERIRTIHKAKGAEYDDVLVWLKDEAELETAIGGEGCEDQRVSYVAMSRAKKRLFLGVPELNEELEQRLDELNVEVRRVEEREDVLVEPGVIGAE